MDILKERNYFESMKIDDLILLKSQKYRINGKYNMDSLILVVLD